jgi:hypothetical protein
MSVIEWQNENMQGSGRLSRKSPAQLKKILASKVFSSSARMKRFLSLVVRHGVQKKRSALKEYSVALAVYDKPPPFDPRLDAIVRVEAGRLRGKLREYYATEGLHDPLAIGLRTGSYSPVFRPVEIRTQVQSRPVPAPILETRDISVALSRPLVSRVRVSPNLRVADSDMYRQ